jgi:hypothetical protein
MRKAASRFSQAFLLGIALLLVLGCSGEKADKGDKDPPPKEPAEKSKPDFSFTAQEFDRAITGDEKGKDEKYSDRVIQLRGTATGFARPTPDSVWVVLDRPMAPEVGFHVRTKDKRPWLKVTPGQEVTIKGTYIGGAFVQSEILEVRGKPRFTLTADQLGAEYAADRTSANKKYKDKGLILTGEVAKKVTDEKVLYLTVVLKTKGKLPVACSFLGEERKLAEKLKAGQQIKVFGRYFGVVPDEVMLDSCLLLEP